MAVSLFTIGYTKSTAAYFFDRLSQAGVRTLIDIRISNRSQLAGFAKMPDLEYFLKEVAGISYRAEPLLAPPVEMMRDYRNGVLAWADYQRDYLALLDVRQAGAKLAPEAFDHGCLLCSEAVATHCHRRLAAEYLIASWPDETVLTHL